MDEIRVLRLLRSVEDCLGALAREARADDGRQADPLWLPGVKYLLQSAIEGCVDLAQHLCAVNGWGPPNDNGHAMRMLGDHEVIDVDLAVLMRRAVGFRNVLVHEYVTVDDEIVTSRVRDHADLSRFVSAIAAWVTR
ncbi:MAG: DUF86 domain-containing protein [Actinomycetota bacterium]|nr:DUF86 domain-containing protein [Actinomycetota bacterium]